MMRLNVLMLVQDQERVIFDTFYKSIDKHCQLDLRKLSAKDQQDLKSYFKSVKTSEYDRIILFVRFKKEIRQIAFIRTLPNIIILEHDAWQNYYAHSKYRGKFSRHYRGLPWVRLLVSGFTLCNKLKTEGFDARFVSKGYDDAILRNLNLERHIEFGFLGSTKNKMYAKRKEMLEAAQEKFGLHICRTASGEAYLEALNKIKFFMSCDYGFGEYMLKNFEAMACGCVLFAWNQGEEENQALGFKDMENIVLYTSLAEIGEKLNALRNNPALSAQIAKNGQSLAESRFSFTNIGRQIVEEISEPLRPKQNTNYILDKIKYFFYR